METFTKDGAFAPAVPWRAQGTDRPWKGLARTLTPRSRPPAAGLRQSSAIPWLLLSQNAAPGRGREKDRSGGEGRVGARASPSGDLGAVGHRSSEHSASFHRGLGDAQAGDSVVTRAWGTAGPGQCCSFYPCVCVSECARQVSCTCAYLKSNTWMCVCKTTL